MKNILLVSSDAELIARVKDALAPLNVSLETSEDFPIEGGDLNPEEMDWKPGCLYLLPPIFSQTLKPVSKTEKNTVPSTPEVQRRSQVDILILDVIRDKIYQVIANIRRNVLWCELPIIELAPIIHPDVMMWQGSRADLTLLRDFDPSELRRYVQAIIDDLSNPSESDGKFEL